MISEGVFPSVFHFKLWDFILHSPKKEFSSSSVPKASVVHDALDTRSPGFCLSVFVVPPSPLRVYSIYKNDWKNPQALLDIKTRKRALPFDFTPTHINMFNLRLARPGRKTA